ncbi:MAG: chemotaxis protein CheW [Ruminococcus sp.]|nr:chemotaxis protein CheW [Ruminococcus sp.]MCM1381042.1 chemotaxis protein CheW [Muribaculaceae bacterium]MCM1479731.1 chemotaxis protein CheW [Muribaculaceae bacterium]
MVENNDVNTSVLPWLIFTLGGNAYAINSSFVNGIEMKSEKITPLPNAADVYCGMVERRGEVYPLLNMRKIFGFKSLDNELSEFKKIIEAKIAEEKAWFGKIIAQLESGETVHMINQNNNRFFDMLSEYGSALTAKIDKAKRAFYDLSAALNKAAEAAPEKRDAEVNAAKEAFRQVLTALDGITKAQENSFREIDVVISDGSQMMGLLVDQVLAVDKIRSVVGSERMRVLMQSKYFEGVARNDRVDLEILVVNEEELMKLSDVD